MRASSSVTTSGTSPEAARGFSRGCARTPSGRRPPPGQGRAHAARGPTRSSCPSHSRVGVAADRGVRSRLAVLEPLLVPYAQSQYDWGAMVDLRPAWQIAATALVLACALL